MNKISIIIPIINEAENIKTLLIHLLENASKENISEIIVVDGGSTDGSPKIVSSFIPSIDSKQKEDWYREETSKVLDNFTQTDTASQHKLANPELRSGYENQSKIVLLDSTKGRAKQMNLGAKTATGNILYFLHADSFPPKDFDKYIIQKVNKNKLAGCFRLQFKSNHWWLRLASWLTQFSWRACRGGDQSQFITKDLFNEIGGFNEDYTIYEDNILINELYARKQFVVINKKIKTSTRRYEKHGVWKLQYHFWTIYVKKWFGASADDLYAYYKKHIA